MSVRVDESFRSQADAEEFIRRYYERFPFNPYMTFLSANCSHDGHWIVTGSRLARLRLSHPFHHQTRKPFPANPEER